MKQLLAIALVCCLASTGAQGQEAGYVESIRCVGGPYGLRLPQDARTLRAMAPLLSETVDAVERWEGYTATRSTLQFDGLELGLILFSNDPAKLMLTRAEIRHPRWNRLMPFKIGQPLAAARAVLGPNAQGDAELKQTYAGDTDSLQFQSSGGLLQAVSYRCYSG